jgi:hypothetical protein
MAVGVGNSGQPIFVLETSVVRWGIEQLLARKIHTFFPAYLELRRRADGEAGAIVVPEWGNLGRYLEVPGGPSKKPYFRPFWHQSRGTGQDWLNPNIAGSYSPSSIRTVPRNVIEVEGSGYSLKDDHAALAVEHLLYDEPLPIYPLATFYYRNFGFTTDGPALPPDGLVNIFRADFRFDTIEGVEEFDTLFSAGIPERNDWFEPWDTHQDSAAEEEH